jgi:hypothetical protein
MISLIRAGMSGEEKKHSGEDNITDMRNCRESPGHKESLLSFPDSLPFTTAPGNLSE